MSDRIEVEKKWWMRILCVIGIHWHGHNDGGGMGDAHACYICGRDNYCPCIIINKH